MKVTFSIHLLEKSFQVVLLLLRVERTPSGLSVTYLARAKISGATQTSHIFTYHKCWYATAMLQCTGRLHGRSTISRPPFFCGNKNSDFATCN